jgi:hypothetical protein
MKIPKLKDSPYYFIAHSGGVVLRGTWEEIEQYVLENYPDCEYIHDGFIKINRNNETIARIKCSASYSAFGEDFKAFTLEAIVALRRGLGLDNSITNQKLRELCLLDDFRRALAIAALKERNGKQKGK